MISRKGIVLLIVCICFIASSSVVCGETPSSHSSQIEEFQPDPIATANDFVTTFLGSSPQVLGIASDTSALASIGQSVLEGNYKKAMQQVGDFAAGKAVSSIPVVGYMVAVGNVGKYAGEKTFHWLATSELEKSYKLLRGDEGLTTVYQFPGTYKEFKRNDELYTIFSGSTRAILFTYIKKHSDLKTEEELERAAIEMLIAKNTFDVLCDKYGLEGKDRTPENLQQEIEIEADISAEIAKENEEKRIAERKHVAEEKLKEEKEEEDQPAEKEEEKSELVSDQESEIGLDEALPDPDMPEEAQAVVAEKPDEVEVLPEPKVEKKVSLAEPLVCSVSARKGEGDTTYFDIVVTNVSDHVVDNVSMTLAAINEIKSGGVGWGQGSSNTISLSPGQSTSVPAMAMGDAQGIQIVVRSGSGFTKALVAKSIHKKSENKEETVKTVAGKMRVDGDYKGVFSGKGFSGSLQLTISGTSVRGVFAGSYKDSKYKMDINSPFKGTYNPENATIKASISGKMTVIDYHDSRYRSDNGFFCDLKGTYSKGSLSGTWFGQNEFDYNFYGGEWSAQYIDRK
ncbi:hypothetical protein RBH88_01755 [Aminobacterium sp. MB27-C1]|uniref:hypothetical protein n=2 Tax=unclassified Aminobacterium TaxID=2685012 RepID=UPI0027DC2C5B|nr:hypothetical protein [Aminobacterium sp. MB27-C1]WMI71845.1 hypothetical protein RBH88_01755 [Aminobacterium sp. MB27-C1]